MSAPANKSRKDRIIYLVGEEKHQITGQKLPSNRDVLSVLIYLTRRGQANRTEDVQLVLKEIEVYWEKARIPISHTSNNARESL